MAKRDPMTLAERVRASEARKIEAGGRRIPGGVLSAEAALALDNLKALRYAKSATACISKALIDAERKINGKR